MNAARVAVAQRAYWLCQFAGWGLYGAGTYLLLVVAGQLSWQRATAAAGIVIVMGIGLSHGLRLFMRQHGWGVMRMSALIPRILAASLILGVLATLVLTSLGLAPRQTDPVAIAPPRGTFHS